LINGGKLIPNTSTSVNKQEQSEIPINLELKQNYPNPFNPSTTIEYQIPRTGNVEIRIFDISGELVNTLKEDQQPVGKYSVKWDGKNNKGQQVASGIYICRIIFRTLILSRKMLLMKYGKMYNDY
jgi:flagellar hook assembly protein FlgD